MDYWLGGLTGMVIGVVLAGVISALWDHSRKKEAEDRVNEMRASLAPEAQVLVAIVKVMGRLGDSVHWYEPKSAFRQLMNLTDYRPLGELIAKYPTLEAEVLLIIEVANREQWIQQSALQDVAFEYLERRREASRRQQENGGKA